ncbi:TSUP family transporter [Desulfofundulus thermocisternus]|jgi:uncharacterized membrane protein YfcA|uniref:TSUP family transporter n=1 Tax=Desulfofundulus thermocisternus TaxID=42471 RepID=UPI0004861F69|nr:TSUP family transporter [Desulfofundulus thermocisternus]
MNPALCFLTGIAGGYLLRAGGPAYRLLTVPLLIIIGFPLPAAVAIGILLNAAGKLKLIYQPDITRQALKRTGITISAVTIPFILTGKQLLLWLDTMLQGKGFILFIYSIILLTAALIAGGRYWWYYHHSLPKDASQTLPSVPLLKKNPLAVPGFAFPRYLTIGRTGLVSVLLGLGTGLLGLNTRAFLEPLLMYITGLPRRRAHATASFILYLTGAFALLIYLPDLFTFPGSGATITCLCCGYLVGYIQFRHHHWKLQQNPENNITFACWGFSSAIILLGSLASGLTPAYTIMLMLGPALVTMINLFLNHTFQKNF